MKAISARTAALVAGCLAALPYIQTLWFGFVNYDDPSHVSDNPVVREGLALRGLAWACGLGDPVPDARWYNWPLTWLSHMLDVSLFGGWAGGHHLMSVALHAANAALVVVLFRSLGLPAAAALFCGVVFAVHPVQVESVAWVSERKTLVSGHFMLLGLIAYLAANRRNEPERRQAASMALAAILTWTALGALALLGKPMAVVLPVLLLFVDGWPLGRWTPHDGRRNAGLVLEKLPLFALALAVGLWTIWSQRQAGAVRDLGEIPLAARLANATCATVEYLGMVVWPVNLAVFYPHPGWRPAWQVCFTAAVLFAVSWWCWRCRRDAPAFLAGWLWFLVSLAPMIGVIQVGNQARADRYLYLAILGPLVAIAGSTASRRPTGPLRPAVVQRGTDRRWLCATATVAVVLLPLTWRQVGMWRDSVALFSSAIASGHDSAVARNNLGLALTELGRPADALAHLQRAVALRDDDADAWFNLGNAHAALGDLRSASTAFERCLEFDPDRFKAWNNVGIARMLSGDAAGAEAAWLRSLGIRADFAEASLNLAKLMLGRGESERAIELVRRVLKYHRANAEAHNLEGVIHAEEGRPADAARCFEAATRLAPQRKDFGSNLERARRAESQVP